MIPPEVLAWLAAPTDFATGAALFKQLGGSSVYQQLFALGATNYSRQVLQQQLQAMVGVMHVESPPEKVVSPPQKVPSSPEKVTSSPQIVASPELTQVRQRLKAARDERSQLHAQLTAPGVRSSARFHLAKRICELTEQVGQLLQAEAHVLAHGRLPGPLPLEQLSDEGELRRRLANLRSQRTRLRKDPQRAKELAQAEADITLIRSKLTPHTSV